MNNQLVIIGMHRSGTSLIARWLNVCGIHFGDRLLGSNETNKYGHFEDMDFLNFHIDLMTEHGLDYDIEYFDELDVSDYFQERAKSIVSFKDKLYQQWGFKDPRTSFFINFWSKILSNPTYLVVYRPREDVVASLIKRDLFLESRKRSFRQSFFLRYKLKNHLEEKYIHYSNVWACYYEQILHQTQNIPNTRLEYCSVDELKKNNNLIVDTLKGKGFHLNQFDFNDYIDNNLFKKPPVNIVTGKQMFVRYDQIASEFNKRIAKSARSSC